MTVTTDTKTTGCAKVFIAGIIYVRTDRADWLTMKDDSTPDEKSLRYSDYETNMIPCLLQSNIAGFPP